MTVTTLLIILGAVYLIASFGIATYTATLVKSGADFMVSGRQLSWFVTGFAVTAIGFSGAFVPLMVSLGYSFGWGGYWFFLTYVLALWFWIPIILRFWRRMGAYSQAEWVEYNFGLSTRAILAVAWSFAVILATGVQFVGMGATIGGALGISAAVATIVFGIFVVVYVAMGGMWAVVTVDVFQALWVALALGLTLPIVLLLTGAPEGISLAGLPEGMTSLPFGTIPITALAIPSVLSFATLHLVLGSMGHYQVRAASIRFEGDIVKAWIFGGILVLLVGIPLTWMGMYTRAVAPDIEPAGALGTLLQQVSPLVAAFALVGIMAATMSTVAGVLIAGSNSLVRDLMERFLGFRGGTATLRNRAAMLGLGGISIIVAVVSPAGIGAFFVLFTAIAAPIIAIHLDTAYIHKATKEGAVATLIVVLAFAFYWQVLAGRDGVIATQNLTIPLAFITLYGVSFLTKLTGPWWSEGQRSTTDQTAIEDENLKREILGLVRSGRGTLSDMADSMEGLLVSGRKSFAIDSLSTSELARYLDHLVEQDLIQHTGRTGRDVVTYELTDAGKDWSSKQDAAEDSDKLDSNARSVLESVVDKGGANIGEVSQDTNLSSGEVLPIFNQLSKDGYTTAKGLLLYEVEPTDLGKEQVEQAPQTSSQTDADLSGQVGRNRDE